jgi:6-phosphogluconolactonase
MHWPLFPALRRAFSVPALALPLLLCACGGGGSGPGGAAYPLDGRVQKGPFAIGSTIVVSELDAGLAPTGQVYFVQTRDALGNFDVSSGVDSNLVEIVGNGYYVEELTGQVSSSTISLRSVANLDISTSPTVNVLTTLEKQRLATLVSQGQTYTAADSQARSEVLAVFGIDASKVGAFSALYQMRIDGSSDADAVLLAVSSILSQAASDAARLNGTSPTAELSSLIDGIAAELAATGTLANPVIRASIASASAELDLAQVRRNLESWYSGHGAPLTAPAFEEWVDQSGSGTLPQRRVPIATLAFADVTGVAPGETVTSESIVVAGAGPGVTIPVTVDAATVVLIDGVAQAGRHAVAHDGQTIALRVTVPATAQTVTATVSAGSSSASWHVTSAGLHGVITGLLGQGLVLHDDAAGDVAVAAGATTFAFPASLAVGTPYAISVTAVPTSPLQQCSIANASGVVGPDAPDIRVSCATSSSLVVGLRFDADIAHLSAYQVDPATGSGLVVGDLALPPPINSLSPATALAADPAGNIVYVARFDVNQIAAFRVDHETAGLAEIPGSPFPAPAEPNALVVTPDGRYLVVGGRQGGAVYAIDPATGVLQPDPRVTEGARMLALAIAPSGQLVFASGDNALASYKLDVETGTLSLADVAATSLSLAVTTEPTGRFVYATNVNDATVSGFAVDAVSGSLTPIAGSPFDTASGPGPLATGPSGRALFVGNAFDSLGRLAVSSWTIDAATGTLTPAPASPVSVTQQPLFLAVDPAGTFLFSPSDVFNVDPASAALAASGSGFENVRAAVVVQWR